MRGLGAIEGEGKGEDGALAGYAATFDPYASAHRFNEDAADIEAEAGATHGADELVAVEAGHVYVDNDAIGSVTGELLQSSSTIGGGENLIGSQERQTGDE